MEKRYLASVTPAMYELGVKKLSRNGSLSGVSPRSVTFFHQGSKPPSVRRLNELDILSGDGEDGRFQAACESPDLIAGWAARFAAAQLAGSRASSSSGRVTGRRSMTSCR